MDKLKNFREEINRIDKLIVKLLDKRVSIVKNVAEFKSNENLPVFSPDTENKKISELILFNREKYNEVFPSEYIEEIFFNIFKSSRIVQSDLFKIYYSDNFSDISHISKLVFGKCVNFSKLPINYGDFIDLFSSYKDSYIIIRYSDLLSFLEINTKFFEDLNSFPLIRILCKIPFNNKEYYILSYGKPLLQVCNKDDNLTFELFLFLINKDIDLNNKMFYRLWNFLNEENLLYSLTRYKKISILKFSNEISLSLINRLNNLIRRYEINLKILGYYRKYYYFS